MDTVNKIMVLIDNERMEILKICLVKELIKRKIFYEQLLFSKYYRVIVDGTQEMTVEEGHCNSCLHRTSKNGKVTYFHNVLEAKLS
ncbi:transposase IS4 family protein, partial [Candidatus Magnetoovum chiemensis]